MFFPTLSRLTLAVDWTDAGDDDAIVVGSPFLPLLILLVTSFTAPIQSFRTSYLQ